MVVVTLLSDFGLKDSYVAQMKAVILSINPRAVIVDIAHDVPKYDIGNGAFLLQSVVYYFPRRTVHLAVLDTGVGGMRKPIVVKTMRNFYVGPDNGLLMLAATPEGVREVYEITEGRLMKRDISPTFHGRDLFSPVAAYLSKRVRVEEMGRPFRTYVQPSFSVASVGVGFVECEVIHIDSFGNVVTNARPTDLSKVGARFGSHLRLRNRRFTFLRTYSEAATGSLLGLIGSHGFFEIAANQRNAAERLGLKRGERLRISVRS